MSKIDEAQLMDARTQYGTREKRFNDAVSLKKPDRVPVVGIPIFFNTRYAGLTNAEAMYDYEKMSEAWKRATQKLNWDMVAPPYHMYPGPVMEKLGLKTMRWPGHDLSENLIYQYVEAEYMREDEYDQLLKDPSDFIIRKVMPRMASTLEPLGTLPPIKMFSSGFSIMQVGATFAGMPSFAQLLENLQRVGQEMNKWNSAQAKLVHDLAEMGYPLLNGTISVVPFDWISDMLRGLQGTMLDMYRQPDKLKAAIELFAPSLIESAISAAKLTRIPRVLIPLHRGSGGFMSNKQFAEFYWPGLKQTCLALIDAGLMPMFFFEGDYTQRLEFLAELPKGKVAGHFDIVDRKKTKEIIGDTMCFWGNVPAQILIIGTPEQVRDDVKELIDIFGDNGGLIIDGSTGIPDEARLENVEAMVETALEYGVHH